MEKYDAIFRTINDKITDLEDIVKMYRNITAEKDARIRELENEVKALKAEIDNSTN